MHPFGINRPDVLPRIFSNPSASKVCHPIHPYTTALPTQNSRTNCTLNRPALCHLPLLIRSGTIRSAIHTTSILPFTVI